MNLKFSDWLNKQRINNRIKVKITDLSKLEHWKIDNNKIIHHTKKFYTIIGIKVLSNFFKEDWDQPMIYQNEIGILGIIKNVKNNKYLLQAKVEPGNINKLQISPTVQATESNYTQVHGGNKVEYLNFFIKKKDSAKFRFSEQGFRYFNKFNSNILINTKQKIKLKNGFIWVSLNHLIKLTKIKNLINMDTLSIISANIKNNHIDRPINSNQSIEYWFKNKDKKFYLNTSIVPLSQLKDWNYSKKQIIHKDKKHFSIVGLDVVSNRREVKKWSQPIIKGNGLAFAGFIIKKFNNTKHYLCKYILKPGIKGSVLCSTINTTEIKNYKRDPLIETYERMILDNFFFNKKYKKNISYDNIMSDEGGRFYHCQIRYMSMLVDDNFDNIVPENYIWISQNQFINFIKKKKIDIEARLLFGCINVKNFK